MSPSVQRAYDALNMPMPLMDLADWRSFLCHFDIRSTIIYWEQPPEIAIPITVAKQLRAEADAILLAEATKKLHRK